MSILESAPIFVVNMDGTLADPSDHFRRRSKSESTLQPLTLAPVYDRFEPIVHAREGMQTLVDNFEFGGYYTAIFVELLEQRQGWLERHGFPDPTNVHIAKLEKRKFELLVTNLLSEGNRPVFMIDDHAERYLKIARQMVTDNPTSRTGTSKLTLFYFGVSDFSQEMSDSLTKGALDVTTGIRIFPFESWTTQNVSRLMQTAQTLYAA